MSRVQKYSEEELVGLLKSRNTSSLEYLYAHYAKALYGIIYKKVGDRELAEEVLQETMLKIWNKASTFDPSKGRLYTWMLTIARNTAIDTSRTSAFSKKTTTDTGEQIFDLIKNAGSYKINEDTIGIREMISELNTKYVQVIDMLYFQGYSQSETAKELDIPLGTIKTRIRKAIEILKSRFN